MLSYQEKSIFCSVCCLPLIHPKIIFGPLPTFFELHKRYTTTKRCTHVLSCKVSIFGSFGRWKMLSCQEKSIFGCVWCLPLIHSKIDFWSIAYVFRAPQEVYDHQTMHTCAVV